MNKTIRVIAVILFVGVLISLGLSREKESSEAKIARLFYENRYYVVLERIYDENLGRYFREQQNSEIVVYLNNLVVYKSNEMIELLEEMPCNLSKSSLIIKAKEPYGPKDYTYIVHCLEP